MHHSDEKESSSRTIGEEGQSRLAYRLLSEYYSRVFRPRMTLIYPTKTFRMKRENILPLMTEKDPARSGARSREHGITKKVYLQNLLPSYAA